MAKRVSLGPPALTEESDLDALSAVTALEVVAAQSSWRADADREHAALLDATEAE